MTDSNNENRIILYSKLKKPLSVECQFLEFFMTAD